MRRLNAERETGERRARKDIMEKDEAAKKAAARAAEKRKKERKERREMRRHRRVFAFLHATMSGIFIRKTGFQYDSIADVEGPYLLLSNHNMEMDPILVGIATKKQLYFVASEHIMRKGFKTWLLRHFFRPIIHTKGKTGTKSVMEIMKTLKKGCNVGLFAEGNRSFNGLTGDILPSTGKLAKAAGASLVTFRMEGGYLSQPRFSTSRRKGRIYGHLVHVYKPDELKAMTDDEMNEAICRDLYEDAYAVQDEKMIPYEGKNLTEGIESTLFYCPQCKCFSTLKSTKDEVRCTCGFYAVYNRFGYLECSDGVTRNMRDWDAEQHEMLRRAVAGGTLQPFCDEVEVRAIGQDHKAGEKLSGTVTMDASGAAWNGKRIPFSELAGLAVYSRNCINLIYGEQEQQYDIRGNTGFCALKYLYLYQEMRKESE